MYGWILVMAVMVCSVFAGPEEAQASLVNYDFYGTLSSFSMGSDYNGALLHVNDPVAVTLTYDDMDLVVLSLRYQIGADGSSLTKSQTYTTSGNTFVSEESGLYATAFTRTPYEAWSLQFGQGGRYFNVRNGNPNSTRFYDIAATLNQAVKSPVQATPLPGTLWLFASGSVALTGVRLRRNRQLS